MIRTLKSITYVYALDNIVYSHFYEPIYASFLKEEVSSGTSDLVKAEIASSLTTLIVQTFPCKVPGPDMDLEMKLQVLEVYNQLLKTSSKPIINDIVFSSPEVFQIFFDKK